MPLARYSRRARPEPIGVVLLLGGEALVGVSASDRWETVGPDGIGGRALPTRQSRAGSTSMSIGQTDLSDHPAPPAQPKHRRPCPSCSARATRIFYEVANAPVESCAVFGDRAAARAVTSRPIHLAICHHCGFVFNATYDRMIKDMTSSSCEVQSCSSRFREFTQQLVVELVEGHGLRGKTVLEIGCGDGSFLSELCVGGDNRGIGVDPAHQRVSTPLDRDGHPIEIIPAYYHDRHTKLDCDALICRHLLEHIDRVKEFVDRVGSQAFSSPNAFALFEVPDARRILQEAAFWDVYYEHCSLFTCGALARLLRSSGFEILDARRGFAGQYVIIKCRPRKAERALMSCEEAPSEVLLGVTRFERRVRELLAAWRDWFAHGSAQSARVVLWGSGSKAASFSAAVGIASDVEYVVNINPKLQGCYIAGTAQQIVPPEFLSDYRPQFVINLNPIYDLEIRAVLERQGVEAVILNPANPSPAERAGPRAVG